MPDVAQEQEVKFCIYSGNGSHRTDWKNVFTDKNGKVFVASDSFESTQFKKDAQACSDAGVDNMEELEAKSKK